MKPINLSFAACGFLGIYHLGAASALCKHGGKLLKDVKAFAGASAGSLVASVLLTAPQKIEECNKFTYDFAEEIRRQPFGALTPGYDFMARLRACVTRMLWMNPSELGQHRHSSDVYEATSHQKGTVRWMVRPLKMEVLLLSAHPPAGPVLATRAPSLVSSLVSAPVISSSLGQRGSTCQLHEAEWLSSMMAVTLHTYELLPAVTKEPT
ncbi:patatin-like phospholipase domain-containing protein 4 isoform X4 [Ovis aries]|uniref:patatin-like phospholipase domain-containing protein 4 isoform X4 n=1 Tax=Ovis aries TaxID=9940 RepID=UPI00295273B4|nr:patatin-like phospholipase domain-containing protein 4 isoform X4 [Ovis aries]